MSSVKIPGLKRACGRAIAAAGIFVAASSLAHAAAAPAGDLLVTAAKPDRLFIIDAAARSVRAEYRVPGAEGGNFSGSRSLPRWECALRKVS